MFDSKLNKKYKEIYKTWLKWVFQALKHIIKSLAKYSKSNGVNTISW